MIYISQLFERAGTSCMVQLGITHCKTLVLIDSLSSALPFLPVSQMIQMCGSMILKVIQKCKFHVYTCAPYMYIVLGCVCCVLCVYILSFCLSYSISKASSLVSLHCHVVDLKILRETVHTCMQ